MGHLLFLLSGRDVVHARTAVSGALPAGFDMKREGEVYRPRVLLADDHMVVIEGLRSVLEPHFELVGTVNDGRALLAAAEKLHPEVVVVDISMPMMNGIEATRRLKKSDPTIKIVFLTMHADATYATRALEAGALGYVLKHSALSDLVKAIREALAGRTYMSPGLVVRQPRRKKVIELTPRQREVLQLVAEGHSAKEVGSILNISTRTVEFHKYRIMEDLHLHNNAELIQYAIRHRIASA